ncbi:hypothetical protein A8C56_07230 [Niabella ginsenosidivorans]|uniref:Uncharacterized protein n=1 Tax=Niabella ginsenosidivorans TaxID=1176587 RepID=A0A1A9I260_9BACT|nr:hypothetical protein A8C56_07230 [Niabella ginsenosidivorans]
MTALQFFYFIFNLLSPQKVAKKAWPKERSAFWSPAHMKIPIEKQPQNANERAGRRLRCLAVVQSLLRCFFTGMARLKINIRCVKKRPSEAG